MSHGLISDLLRQSVEWFPYTRGETVDDGHLYRADVRTYRLTSYGTVRCANFGCTSSASSNEGWIAKAYFLTFQNLDWACSFAEEAGG